LKFSYFICYTIPMSFASDLGIVIPYRGDLGYRERLIKYNVARLRCLVPEAQIVVQDSKQPLFNRSEARNLGAKKVNREFLLLLDADTVFNVDQIKHGVGVIASGVAPWVIAYQDYYSLTEDASWKLMEQKGDVKLGTPQPGEYMFKLKSFAGVLLMRKSVFDAVGGYDERFQGWGYEDNAFKDKMDTLQGTFARVNGNAYHLWHPRSEEENFGQPNIKANELLYNRYGKAKGRPEIMRKLASE